jgi:hypothetical protein
LQREKRYGRDVIKFPSIHRKRGKKPAFWLVFAVVAGPFLFFFSLFAMAATVQRPFDRWSGFGERGELSWCVLLFFDNQ